MTASRKDRVIEKITALMVAGIYREVSIHWAAEPPEDGPELSLSNHFGGFSDGLVLVHALPRRPGVIARDVIWKIPLAGALMRWIGGIPVHQPEDGGSSSNDQMFSSCYEALRRGRHLLIFPEGVTRDDPSIGRVKTGAARIALGARSSGAEGLVVTPVGIHYEDKAALRSRVVVIGGPPIRLDDVVSVLDHDSESPNADDRGAVRSLTEVFDAELRTVAPDYDDWHESRQLTAAAEITLRSYQPAEQVAVPIAQRDRLANALAARSEMNRHAVREAVVAYEADLDGLGLDDATFTGQIGTGRFGRRLAGQVAIGLLLLPFAVLGALINIVPFIIMKLVGALRVSPAVLASVKPLLAMLVFGITWGIEIWGVGQWSGPIGLAAALILIPTYSIAAVLVFDRTVLMWRTFKRWRAGSRSNSAFERLQSERSRVVGAVMTP